MIASTTDTAVLDARRALPEAEGLLADGLSVQSTRTVACAFHGPDVHTATGAVCVVLDGGPHEDLVGKRLAIRNGTRRVVVLCLERADNIADLSLSRRAWLALAPASAAPLDLDVEVLG